MTNNNIGNFVFNAIFKVLLNFNFLILNTNIYYIIIFIIPYKATVSFCFNKI